MGVGEKIIFDWNARNLRNQNLKPGMVIVIDDENTDPNMLACTLPEGTGDDVFLGVVTETTHLNQDGTITDGQTVAFRDIGYVWCKASATASGVIAAGARVIQDGTDGRIKSNATGFGTALTPSAAENGAVLVRLGSN